jgi:hypothetical protein
LAVQLRFFATYGFFVQDRSAIPADGISYLAEQLGFDADAIREYDFDGRTARRHCAEILQHLGYRRLKRADREALTSWIASDLCPTGQSAVRTFMSSIIRREEGLSRPSGPPV